MSVLGGVGGGLVQACAAVERCRAPSFVAPFRSHAAGSFVHAHFFLHVQIGASSRSAATTCCMRTTVSSRTPFVYQPHARGTEFQYTASQTRSPEAMCSGGLKVHTVQLLGKLLA